MKPIHETLNQRGSVHGPYWIQSGVAQNLKASMSSTPNWASLSPTQVEALNMIASKVSRILCGDPNHADHWHDIAGYATLVETWLSERVSGGG